MVEELSAEDLVRRLANGSRLEAIEAAKALSRRNDRAVLPEVSSVLRRGESEHARQMAAWLLGEMGPGTDVSLEALYETVSAPDASESLRGQAIEALGNQISHLTGGETYERVADALIALLRHSSVEILYNAVFALGAMRCRRARSELVRIAGEDHRKYNGLEALSQNAQFAIGCIDYEPHGR